MEAESQLRCEINAAATGQISYNTAPGNTNLSESPGPVRAERFGACMSQSQENRVQENRVHVNAVYRAGSILRALTMPKSVFTGAYASAVEILVALRKRAGLSQVELARRLAKPQQFISNV